MKDKVTTKAANTALEPLIEFVRENRGAIQELTDRLSKRTKKKWNRDNVERWLHRDPKKRVQPLLGVGLCLIRECQLMMAAKVETGDFTSKVEEVLRGDA
jgi:hypothetical protein